MCGICGIIRVSGKVSEWELERMTKVLAHRGPDDRGHFISNNVGLGHTRLSIIDLSVLGHQPMQFDDVVISYNGEVYNFEEIRSELMKSGYSFQSNSDTEVMLKAYHCWGIKAIEKFNGMFSFCLFDKRKNELYLVRDRFGVKPLYYSTDDGQFIFASSIKAIQQIKKTTCISKDAISQYLNLLYIPGEQTIYKDIVKLAAGHYLRINLETGEQTLSRYYELNIVEHEDSLENSIRKIDDLLNDSVQKRMISDVPVGVFLSGGVDSSLVCAIAASHTSRPLNTFSVGFDAMNQYADETQYALAVSKKYNTKHIRFEVDFNKVFAEFDDIISFLDEPNADTSVFLNYYIAKLSRQHVTVALSGVGGDELFGGYNRYQAYLLGQNLLKVPGFLMKFLKFTFSKAELGRTGKVANISRAINKLFDSIHENPAQFYYNLVSYYPTKSNTNFQLIDGDLNFWMKHDIENYLPGDILSLTDQMSMAHSLEVREPFLDFRLADLSMKISSIHKVRLMEKKVVLKKLAEKYIDRKVIYRRKHGFSAPVEPWLKMQGLSKFMNDFKEGALFTYVQQDYAKNILDGFFLQGKDYSLQLYSLVVLNKWLRFNLS